MSQLSKEKTRQNHYQIIKNTRNPMMSENHTAKLFSLYLILQYSPIAKLTIPRTLSSKGSITRPKSSKHTQDIENPMIANLEACGDLVISSTLRISGHGNIRSKDINAEI